MRVKRPRFPSLTLEYGLWTSANLTTRVAAYLLQDVLGVQTTLIGYARPYDAFQRVAAGVSDASLEVWTSNKKSLFVTRQGLVEQLGLLHYTGQISWYFPSFIVDANPHLIFNSWRSLLDPGVLALLPLANSTSPGRDATGNFLCQESWCTDGVFVPPWCAGPNAVVCREVFMPIPEYNMGESEQRIVSLALPLVVVYLGHDRFTDEVSACLASTSVNSTCLFYYWTPDPLIVGRDVVRVHFEDPHAHCWDRFNASLVLPASSGSYLACDWPLEFLEKIARAGLRNDAPELREFLRRFSLDATDVAFLLSAPDSSAPNKDVACTWVEQFESKWSGMIPEPTSVRTFLPMNMLSRAPILVVTMYALLFLVCLVGITTLWRYRARPSLRVQSPGALMIMAAGAGVAGTGVVLPLISTATTTGLCRASLICTDLGSAVALAAILAKAWRLYLVFLNPHASFIVFSRLIRVSVSDKALLVLGSTVVATAAVLAALAAVDLTISGEFMDIDVLSASFVAICTPPTRAGIAAQVGLAFRVVLALVTAGVAFRVRFAFTTAGDAYGTWVAAAVLALACAIAAMADLAVHIASPSAGLVDLTVNFITRMLLVTGLLASTVSDAVLPALRLIAGFGVTGPQATKAAGLRQRYLISVINWPGMSRHTALSAALTTTTQFDGQGSVVSLPDDNDFRPSVVPDHVAAAADARLPTIPEVPTVVVDDSSLGSSNLMITPLTPAVVVDPAAATLSVVPSGSAVPASTESTSAANDPPMQVSQALPVPGVGFVLSSGSLGVIGTVAHHMAVRQIARSWWTRPWSRMTAPWINVSVLLVPPPPDAAETVAILVMIPTAKNFTVMRDSGASTVNIINITKIATISSPSASGSDQGRTLADPTSQLHALIGTDPRRLAFRTRNADYVLQATTLESSEFWAKTGPFMATTATMANQTHPSPSPSGFWHGLCPSGDWSAIDPSKDVQDVSPCFLAWIVLTAVPVSTAVLVFALYRFQYRKRSASTANYAPLASPPATHDLLDDLDNDDAVNSHEVEAGSGLRAPTAALAVLRDLNERTWSLARRAQVAAAAAYAVSLAYGALMPGTAPLDFAWLALHSLLAAAIATAAIRLPASRMFPLALITGVDTACMLVYLRSALLGATELAPSHALPIVQSSLALASFIFSTLEYNRATHLKQEAILAAFPDDAAKPSLEPFASVWQLATFSWFTPLVHRGYQQALQLVDLWDLALEDKSVASIRAYTQNARPGRSMIVTVLITLRYLLAYQILVSILSAVTTFAGPFFLNRLLAFLERDDGTVDAFALEPYLYVAGLFLGATITSIFQGQTYFTGRRVGTRLRAIMNSLLYRKTLTRNQHVSTTEADADKGGKDDGDEDDSAAPKRSNKQDINVLIGTDMGRIIEYFCYVQFLFTTPIQIAISITGLYYVLGWSALTGVALLIVAVPIQSWAGQLVEKRQEKLMSRTDARVEKTQEVLQGIRIVKYFAWESSFVAKLRELRNKELRALRRYWLLMAAVNVGYHAVPTLVSLLTFVMYTKIAGHDLDATTVFTCISLFNALRYPLWDLPDQIIRFFETRVSVNRVQAYLNDLDVHNYTIDTSDPAKGHGDKYIGAVNATLSWPSRKKDDSAAAQDSTAADAKETTPLLASSDSSSTLAQQAYGSNPSAATEQAKFQLKNLTMTVPRGKLTVILGPTGAGKSTLLHAFLGELALESGNVYMPHTPVAYVPQQAWLLNATVKENVLFGATEEPRRYKNIIKACALKRDLEILEAGDNTQVGEKGIALSGGQKSRLSLARACYTDTDVVLLDDVLSAVDAPTAAHLFQQCILGELAGRTRVLVTHNVGLVAPWADHILYVKEGRVVAEADTIGTAAAQLAHAGLYAEAEMLSEVATPVSLSRANSVTTLDAAGRRRSMAAGFKGKGKAKAKVTKFIEQIMGSSSSSSSSSSPSSSDAEDSDSDEADANKPVKVHQLISDEEKAQGSVEWKVYATYIAAAGGAIWWALLLSTLFLPQLLNVAQDWWLKTWAQAYTRVGVYVAYALPSAITTAFAMDPAKSDVDVDYYLLVYLGLSTLNIGLQYFQNMLEMSRSMAASTKLHDALLERVLGAPISWFDSVPVGRLVNRFSKDIQTIDREVIWSLMGTAWCGASVLITIGVVTSIAPAFLLFVFPVVFMYRYVANYYLASSRELKRLESVTRSPIFSTYQETASGTSVIRAFHKEAQFLARAHERMDVHHRAFFWLWVCNRWLSIRIDFCSNVTVLACGLVILLTGNMYAGTAGLALSWAMTVSDSCLWFVRIFASMEMNMNAIERTIEYSTIDQEAQGGAKPSVVQWPMRGALKVENLVMQYPSSTTPVLHGISFELNPREKCGVVGRTGAGKSSLALALLRMIEPQSGSVEIDGSRLSDMDLTVLRSRVTMVPQDPVLFEGTIRSNLDVLDEFDDATCLNALERVHFFESTQQVTDPLDTAAAKDGDATAAHTSTWTLDSKVDANGKNLSVGQRQLLALARALVRRSKVIIMDESTANVSHDLDAKIQQTVRSEFAESTILCIAHRLRTIADFDKVLVLDHGRVVEFGSPAELIANTEGTFHHMCRESGEFEYLYALATTGTAPSSTVASAAASVRSTTG
ncbi:hypothetical protein GGF31_000611 [Allomyces arbusculus]|nr:hypothetical protein GGF31_000611 [Allomyces arbusculus]